jgi:hypothetical protein
LDEHDPYGRIGRGLSLFEHTNHCGLAIHGFNRGKELGATSIEDDRVIATRQPEDADEVV